MLAGRMAVATRPAHSFNFYHPDSPILVCVIASKWERSGSVVECLTRDRGAASSRFTGVTALWSLSKTHLS